jgi:hypothetical protein
MVMKLYEVIFWGGQGERDSIYLVRAPDHLAAVEALSGNTSPRNHRGIKFPVPHAIHELGVETTLNAEEAPKMLRGPYVESAYNHGWRYWRRPDLSEGTADDWIEGC